MSSHVIDMVLLRNNFGTADMRSIWSEHNRLQKHFDVEAALALAEGEFGIIPRSAAETIAKNAKAEFVDFAEIASEAAKAKHSLNATIKALQSLCGEDGEYVHFGATTQDIVDTGTILQLKEAHALILSELKEVAGELAKLAEKYKSTPMAGRSHGMQGLPTTFGFKLSVVLSEVNRHIERLKGLEARTFTGVIAGGVGTFASFGPKGPEIEANALQRLGLSVPEICWHSSRDRIAEYASVIGLISGTLGKLANEFYNLMRSEIDEVEEPFAIGKIGSTTMPHKRNPAALEGIASLTRPILHSVSLIQDSLIVEHERDAMSWRGEWIALPEICIYLSAQLLSTKTVLQGLIVKPDNMLRNLNLQGGLLLSERVMFALAESYGKQTAHELIYELSMKAIEEHKPFQDVLVANEQVAKVLDETKIKELLNPETYLGSAIEKVDQVLLKQHFRLAVLDDAEELLDLTLRAYQPIRDLGINFAAAHADLDLVKKHITHNLCYVLEQNGKMIATVAIRLPWGGQPGPAGLPHIGWLAVDPANERQGIGSKILSLAEEKITSDIKSPAVTLGTAENHPWLSAMYESKGYHKIGTKDLGRGHTTVYFKKDLQAAKVTQNI
ncbi:adenylosuccinate lyase [Paenibacillus polymyxa]|uniref:adenylosuccinate lyase n=1 Tax=Paenibacillus TaxID=44249 RepID=UPI00279486E9|nr:adenylosuccinate lyase [Paenibacillus polymyxa]MDQ0049428.1 adenylosuccinate lyase [Paenibacillus polymyxa]